MDIMKHTAIARSSKPVNPVNRKRKDAQFAKAFGEQGRDGEWIRAQPCSVPGCKRGPIHAHHARSQGAGGDSSHLVPLCHSHHADLHDIGRDSFSNYHGIDLMKIAARLYKLREETT